MIISTFAKQVNSKFPYAGALLWVSSFQFFVVQYFAGNYWPEPYSYAYNTISDLGVTTCGTQFDRYICSPMHSWFNASLIVLGITMLLGSLFLYYQLGKNKGSRIGFIFMGIGGIGTTIVGLFPLGTIGALHAIGAFLPFFIGNVGVLLFGIYLPMPKLLRVYTILTGVVTLTALALFATQTYLGIGIGGMERFVGHPQPIWLTLFGIYLLSRLPKSNPLA